MTRLALLVALVGCNFVPAGIDEPDAAVTPTSGDAPAASQITCAGKAAVARRDDLWVMTSGGLLRSVAVHVPASYDPTRGMPLVLDIHGFTSDAVQEQLLSGMPAKADAEGFITMQPFGLGLPRSFNAGVCCGVAAATHVDDVAFISALIDKASEELCIDPARIYATGMSNGGFLSHRLGCELSDRIAAIAPVAGTLGISSCHPTRPMPVMAFNGTSDPLVPYEGSTALGFIAVPDAFAGWAARDGCVGSPTVTFAHGDATCRTYDDCDGGAEVTLCTIDGGGHTWPGGIPIPAFGKTSGDISATDAMWAFFKAHSLADN
jgi:polyhydroxybutyrate depolymerase